MRNLRLGLVLLSLVLGAGGCSSSSSKTARGVGEPCSLPFDAYANQAAYVSNAADCPSHMCLKPAGLGRDTVATCSAPCTSDSDCQGSLRDPTNPDDKRCRTGFTCAVPFEVGPQCCQKMCMCKDFFGEGVAPLPDGCNTQRSPELVCKATGPLATPATPDAALKYVTQTQVTSPTLPVPMLDLIFLVDNSPNMAAKQEALAAAVPALLDELNSVPGLKIDLHIGFVSSDLGTGTSATWTGCRVQGDRGAFRMKAGCGANSGALWLEQGDRGSNFTGDLATVLACASRLGIEGCSYEQQLKAAAVALQRPEHAGFLRDDAYLGIVLLTDEDDCSAPWDSDMFTAIYPNETSSLRCATRGHLCNGKALEFPTTQAFEANLSDCQPDDSGSPLMRVQEVVQAVRDSKPRPSEQIVVGGLFGWPLQGQNAQYRIDKDPTAGPGAEGKWDYLPTCESTKLGKRYAGLRMKAFVDAFGDNGQVYSLCNDDLTPALKQFGAKLREKITPGCIDVPLVDTDPADGMQPDCRVQEMVPNGKTYASARIPACHNSATVPCWRVDSDSQCRMGLRMRVDHGTAADGAPIPPPPGALFRATCRTCPAPDGNCPPSWMTD